MFDQRGQAQLPADRDYRLHWHPLAYDDSTAAYFDGILDQEAVFLGPLPPGYIAATALRLTRTLGF